MDPASARRKPCKKPSPGLPSGRDHYHEENLRVKSKLLRHGGSISFGQRRRSPCAGTRDGTGLPGDVRAGGGAVDAGSASGSAVAQPAVVFVSCRAPGRLSGVCYGCVVGGVVDSACVDRPGMVMGGIRLLLAAGLVVYAVGWPHRRCAAANPAYAASFGAAWDDGRVGADRRGAASAAFGSPGARISHGNQSLSAVSCSWRSRRATCASFGGASLLSLLLRRHRGLVPSVSFSGILQRTPAVVTVARMVAVLLACWYGFPESPS